MANKDAYNTLRHVHDCLLAAENCLTFLGTKLYCLTIGQLNHLGMKPAS